MHFSALDHVSGMTIMTVIVNDKDRSLVNILDVLVSRMFRQLALFISGTD